MKKQFRGWLTLWSIGAAAVLTALVLTTATYAWFTVNREVQTAKVTAATGASGLELQISRTGADAFSPGTLKDAAGQKISGVALNPCEKELMPVSTADLKQFLYCSFSEENAAKTFEPTTDETLYYHDTIYLRAVGEGLPDGAQMALYLDNDTQNPIVRSGDGKLLTAARLGLTFDGAAPVIMKLSDAADQGKGNTYLNGQLLSGGNVLGYHNGAAVAVKDPVVSLKDAQFSPEAPDRKPMVTLKINQIYQIDIYFYLEGCDPDCLTERVGLTEAYLNLAFFGLLAQ